MIPDLKFLRERYDLYNLKYFDGNLPLVKILLTDAKNCLGNLRYKIERKSFGKNRRYDFVIRISRAFDREENEVEDTLIHEMIHLYIAYRNISDSAPHGVEFRKIMNHINRTYGRKIAVSHRASRDGEIKLSDTRRHWHVVGVVKLNDDKYGFKVIPRVRTTIEKFRKGILLSPMVECVDFYLSDNPFFHKFPNSGALRIHIMEENIIRQHLLNSSRLNF